MEWYALLRDGVEPKITIYRSCHAMEKQLYKNAMECSAFVQCRHKTKKERRNTRINAGSNALLLALTLLATPRYHQHTLWTNTWLHAAGHQTTLANQKHCVCSHVPSDAEHHNAPENHMLHRATHLLTARASRRERGRVDANTSTTTCADIAPAR